MGSGVQGSESEKKHLTLSPVRAKFNSMNNITNGASNIKLEAETIPIHEAKSNLSKLVKRAAAGETIYIGAYGKPEAILTAVNINKIRAERRKQACGCMKGKIIFREGWDDPLPQETLDLFYNSKGLEEFEKK